MSSKQTGRVKWFDDKKGFGFIKPDGSNDDVFVHHTGIQMQGFKSLRENQAVEYDVVHGKRGPQADNVIPLAG